MNKYAHHHSVMFIVDKFHVGTPDEEIRQEIIRRGQNNMTPRTLAAVVKGAIQRHHENRRLYSYVMSGGHGYTGRNPRKRRSFSIKKSRYYRDLIKYPDALSVAQIERMLKGTKYQHGNPIHQELDRTIHQAMAVGRKFKRLGYNKRRRSPNSGRRYKRVKIRRSSYYRLTSGRERAYLRKWEHRRKKLYRKRHLAAKRAAKRRK